MILHKPSSALVPAIVAIAAGFALRLILGELAPSPASPEQAGGDTLVFLRVAENLYHNGCVSISAVENAACAPHWGGTQLPLYPAFIATVWRVFGPGDMAPIYWTQALLFSLALLRLANVLTHLPLSSGRMLAILIVVSFSPLTFAWTRVALTEFLATAAAIWILAELLNGFARQRFNLVALGIAISAAIWLRYDMVTVAVPVGFALIAASTKRQFLRRTVILSLIIGLPLAGWAARSVGLGLTATPTLLFDRTEISIGSGPPSVPRGFAEWVYTWSHGIDDDRRTIDQAMSPDYRYEHIDPPAHAFGGSDDRQEVERLLVRAAQASGTPWPSEVDAAFERLANQRRAENAAYFQIWMPLVKAHRMWTTTEDSSAWPSPLGVSLTQRFQEIRSESAPIKAIITTFAEHPLTFALKAAAIVYRWVLLGAILFVIIVIVVRRRLDLVTYAGVLALGFATAKTALPAVGGFPRARYLVETVPFVEMATLLALFVVLDAALQSRRKA